MTAVVNFVFASLLFLHRLLSVCCHLSPVGLFCFRLYRPIICQQPESVCPTSLDISGRNLYFLLHLIRHRSNICL